MNTQTQLNTAGRNEDGPREEDISDELINQLFKVYNNQTAPAEQECEHTEMAIAYALNELEGEDANQVRDHLSGCRACLETVTDVRLAESQGKRSFGDYWKIARFSIYDFFSGLMPAKAAYGLVGAVAALVIGIGVVLQTLSPPTDQGVGISGFQPLLTVSYRSKGANSGSDSILLKDNETLVKGDQTKLKFTLDGDSYFYLLLAEEGQVSVIEQGRAEKGVARETDIALENKPFGLKTVWLLACEDEIKDLTAKLERLTQISPTGRVDSAAMKQVFPGMGAESMRSWDFRYQLETD